MKAINHIAFFWEISGNKNWSNFSFFWVIYKLVSTYFDIFHLFLEKKIVQGHLPENWSDFTIKI